MVVLRTRCGFRSDSPRECRPHRLTIVAAIFDSIFVPEAVQETVSDGAWVRAMLDAEAALAAAQAAEGVISAEAAAAVARACEGELDLSGAP